MSVASTSKGRRAAARAAVVRGSSTGGRDDAGAMAAAAAPNVQVSVAVSVAAPASALDATSTSTSTLTMRATGSDGAGAAAALDGGGGGDLQRDTAELRAAYARFVAKWRVTDARARADAQNVLHAVESVLPQSATPAAVPVLRHRTVRADAQTPAAAAAASNGAANDVEPRDSAGGGWYRDMGVAWPMVSAVAFFVSCLLTTGVFNSIANERRLLHRPLQRDDEPGTFAHRLPDVLFDVLPSVDNNWWPNALTYGFILWASFWVLRHARRLTLTRRLLAPWGVLLVMRCSTVTLTSLPDPNHMCYGSANPIQDQLMSFVSGISCGDMIFSGHTVAMCCCAFVLVDAYPYHTPLSPAAAAAVATAAGGGGKHAGSSGSGARLEECRPWHWLLHAISTVWVTCGVLSLLVTRFHYTVDVVLAVYFALFVTVAYRLYVGDAARVSRSRFARWFERDAHAECDACSCRCRNGRAPAHHPHHHSVVVTSAAGHAGAAALTASDSDA